MALSDDQRAMLRLLAQREQGYEDMAALMGVSVEELRGRVKAALAELEKEGKEAPELPPEPEATKPAPEEPKADPAGPKPTPEPAAPTPPVAAEPPELSATPPSGQVPPSTPPQKKGSLPLPSSSGARIGIAAVAAAIAVVVVLLIVLGGGDSDSDSSTATTAASAEASSGSAVSEAIEAAETTKGGKELTKAVLQSTDGSATPSGIAIFGRVKQKLALQIVAEGLQPLGSGESYAIWIAQSPTRMLPLAASPVNEKGQIASQFEVPTELLAYLANETFDEVTITRASVAKLNTALRAATKAKETPAYTGTPVMNGTITGPIVGAAKRLEAEEGKGGG